MKHYIIVKFNDDYDYLNELEEIQELFNKSLTIDGVDEVEIYKSNSKLANRYDLMIKMDLTHDGLKLIDKCGDFNEDLEDNDERILLIFQKK